MTHELWRSRTWSTASEEEVIQALFNAPEFLDLRDMAELQRCHPQAKQKYLNLFYEGQIPKSVKKLHRI